MNTIKKIAKGAWDIFKKYPATILPFLIMGVMDFVVLYVLYLAPQRPVSIVLAPPVQAFWGEQYLHYPMNLFLLPKLYNHAHMLLLATLGILTTGCAITMIHEASGAHKPRLFSGFVFAFKRYVSLLIIGVVVFLISFFLGNASGLVATPLVYGIYFLHIVVQIVFLYAMVAIVVNKSNVILAVKQSFALAKRSVIPTLVIAAIALVLYLPAMFLKQNLPLLIKKSFPEVVIAVLSINIMVTMIIDVVITFLVTRLFLEQEKQK